MHHADVLNTQWLRQQHGLVMAVGTSRKEQGSLKPSKVTRNSGQNVEGVVMAVADAAQERAKGFLAKLSHRQNGRCPHTDVKLAQLHLVVLIVIV